MSLPKRNPIIILLYALLVLLIIPFLIWYHWQPFTDDKKSAQVINITQQVSSVERRTRRVDPQQVNGTMLQVEGISKVVQLNFKVQQQINALWHRFAYSTMADDLAENNYQVMVVYSDYNADQEKVKVTLGYRYQNKYDYSVSTVIAKGSYLEQQDKQVLGLWSERSPSSLFKYETDYEIWTVDSQIQPLTVISYLGVNNGVINE